MTNGEKFKKIFKISQAQVDEGELYAYVWLPTHDAIEIPLEWWNAEYEEPTTKNDLGVDCVARQDVERFIEGFINEYTPEEELEFINLELDGLKHLPPATPQEPRWIPVSEKLPEPFTFVNATCRSLVDDRENWVVETIYLPFPKEVDKHRYSDWGNILMLNQGEAEVIAWVERIIPQPYKAEGSKEA